MATQTTSHGTGTTLKAFEDKIVAQMQEAEALIEEFEAKAREKRMQAEIAAVNGLKTARQNIERSSKISRRRRTRRSSARRQHRRGCAALKTSLDESAASSRCFQTM